MKRDGKQKGSEKFYLDALTEKYQGTVDLKLCRSCYDDSPPCARFSSESCMWSNSKETRGATSMEHAAKPCSHHSKATTVFHEENNSQ